MMPEILYLYSHDYTFITHPIRCRVLGQCTIESKNNAFVIELQEDVKIGTFSVSKNEKSNSFLLYARHFGYDIADIGKEPFFCNVAVINTSFVLNENLLFDQLTLLFTCEAYLNSEDVFPKLVAKKNMCEKIVEKIKVWLKSD